MASIHEQCTQKDFLCLFHRSLWLQNVTGVLVYRRVVKFDAFLSTTTLFTSPLLRQQQNTVYINDNLKEK